MKPSISIVCATIDSPQVILDFVRRIDGALATVHDQLSVEVLIIDQCCSDAIGQRVSAKHAEVRHFCSSIRGLSLNRNIGIRESRNEWIAFLDSDCSVSVDYFLVFLDWLRLTADVSMLVGRILSSEKQVPILRHWSATSFFMNQLDIWKFSTSVNCIYKRSAIHFFDEKLGIGAQYGSCEDVDFALSVVGLKFFTPELVVFHPEMSFSSLSDAKMYNYSRGFGALCRKRVVPLGLIVFIASIASKFVHALLMRISWKQFFISTQGKISGFLYLS